MGDLIWATRMAWDIRNVLFSIPISRSFLCTFQAGRRYTHDQWTQLWISLVSPLAVELCHPGSVVWSLSLVHNTSACGLLLFNKAWILQASLSVLCGEHFPVMVAQTRSPIILTITSPFHWFQMIWEWLLCSFLFSHLLFLSPSSLTLSLSSSLTESRKGALAIVLYTQIHARAQPGNMPTNLACTCTYVGRQIKAYPCEERITQSIYSRNIPHRQPCTPNATQQCIYHSHPHWKTGVPIHEDTVYSIIPCAHNRNHKLNFNNGRLPD